MYAFEYWAIGVSLLVYAPSAFQLYRLSKRQPVVAARLDGFAIVGVMISTIVILSLILNQFGHHLGDLVLIVATFGSVGLLLSPFYLAIRARNRYDKMIDS